MSVLSNKNILIGLTGSIAAYKTVQLIRLLKTQGANIKVVLTHDAREFITELTLQAVSGEPVHSQLLDPSSEASMSHITLAKWADLFLIAPATANIMAKFNAGLADDLLSTLYLACSAPVVVVPAMNQQMWQHPATQKNVACLLNRGVKVWGPDFGSQACGDIGPGRMLEPPQILQSVERFLTPPLWAGLKVIITAGPTREPIDAVRFISNYSSGKMGYALAHWAANLGAEVILISGPTQILPPDDIQMIRVQTADEMYQSVLRHIQGCHILIGCAAVADYRCINIATHKIKKPAVPSLHLEKTVDILRKVGQLPIKPFLVGFAAESDDLIDNAKIKLLEKNLDMIVANYIGSQEAGFDSDNNKVSVIMPDEQINFELMSKYELARELLLLISQAYRKKITQEETVVSLP